MNPELVVISTDWAVSSRGLPVLVHPPSSTRATNVDHHAEHGWVGLHSGPQAAAGASLTDFLPQPPITVLKA